MLSFELVIYNHLELHKAFSSYDDTVKQLIVFLSMQIFICSQELILEISKYHIGFK